MIYSINLDKKHLNHFKLYHIVKFFILRRMVVLIVFESKYLKSYRHKTVFDAVFYRFKSSLQKNMMSNLSLHNIITTYVSIEKNIFLKFQFYTIFCNDFLKLHTNFWLLSPNSCFEICCTSAVISVLQTKCWYFGAQTW